MKQKGFTLVEILIVVAILGLLAAIAIPNFQRAKANTEMRQKLGEEFNAADISVFCKEQNQDESLFYKSEVLQERFRQWKKKNL